MARLGNGRDDEAKAFRIQGREAKIGKRPKR